MRLLIDAFSFSADIFSIAMSCCLVKKGIGMNHLLHALTRVQPVICIPRCSYAHTLAHDISVSLSGGPVSMLKQRIARGELMEDVHQMKVVQNLQRIYQEVHHYKPQQLNLLEKWFGTKRREAPKGLYIYGAVGGGKTMLMDLFYDCCQVSLGLLFV